jgi:hypothetical protein
MLVAEGRELGMGSLLTSLVGVEAFYEHPPSMIWKGWDPAAHHTAGTWGLNREDKCRRLEVVGMEVSRRDC